MNRLLSAALTLALVASSSFAADKPKVEAKKVDVGTQAPAFKIKDANGRAYNRTKNLDERKRMLQEWADYLDKLKAGAEVIPINPNAVNVHL